MIKRRFALCLIAGLLLLPMAALRSARADGATAEAMLPEGAGDVAWRLTDGDENSRVQIGREETLALRLPEGAEYLLLTWHQPPEDVSIAQFNGAGAAIAEDRAAGVYETLLPLERETREVRLSGAGGFVLSEYRLMSGEEAAACPAFPLPERVDLMLIAAHTGDEAALFSGLLPSLAERGLSSVTVFLSHRNRMAQQEAMETAFRFSQPVCPVFLGERYLHLNENYADKARKIWPEKECVEALVSAIRQYRPAVIVTHSEAGENGDMMRSYTAQLVRQAVTWAADPRKDRDSLALYGTHEVQKLYLRGASGAEEDSGAETQTASVVLDYARPLNACAGQSGAELANEALSSYSTVAIYAYEAQESDSFCLAATRVGEDSGANDLFQNLAPESLTNHGAALPTPSPAPTPSPTPQPEPEPEQDPAPSAEQPASPAALAQEEREDGRNLPMFFALLGGAALSVLLSALAFTPLSAKRGKPLSIAICALPALAGLLAAFLMRPAAPQTVEGMAETPEAPAPAAAQSSPTLPPATTPAEPDGVGAASPDPWAAYFRQPGEPEETVLADETNGRWEYRSDTLSIRIEKREDGSVPLVWYVAHIRMREDAFRPGFGSFNEGGSARLEPWKLARRAGAVLAITGDNLINGEVLSKGRLIRNGLLYGEGDGQPTLALCPDMSLRIYERGTPAETILDDGVQNTFGFGPVLVRDGAVSERECLGHRVKNRNPRAGIGMVEPGHYVAIVVDGRQAGYSIGVTLVDYAQMFVDEGCTLAYNMDGGISSGMLFMGESIHQHRSSKSKRSSGQRSWSDALLFGYSALVPTEDDPIYSTGNLDEKIPRETALP